MASVEKVIRKPGFIASQLKMKQQAKSSDRAEN
jgi:hypothetical protein